MNIKFVIATTMAIIFLFLFLSRLLKDLKMPLIDWNDKDEFPTNIREDRNISEDVLIYDLDTEKIFLGYFMYNSNTWIAINNNSKMPNNFVWAYLND
jgi:hypothetical protein